MANQPRDRKAASGQALAAQGAFAVLILAGLGVAAVGVPGLGSDVPPTAVTLPEVAPPAPRKGLGVQTRPVDQDAVAARMQLISNRPVQPAPAGGSSTPTETPPAPPAQTKYLGAVAFGATYMGLISHDSKQRFVRVGQTLADGSRVVEITPERLVTEGPNGRQVYEVGQRTGDILTRGTASPGTTGFPVLASKPLPTAPGAQGGDASRGALSGVGGAMAAGAGKGGRGTDATGGRGGPGGGIAGSTGGTRRTPGDPDGSPERLQEIIQQLKKSSDGLMNEDELHQKAKALFEEESIRYERGLK
jgi:hypothetical protein